MARLAFKRLGHNRTLPAAPGDHLDPFVTVVRLADPAELVVEYRGAEQTLHRGRVIETPLSAPPARLTQERAVEVGLVTASEAEIVRGLDAGEQVIVR